MEGGGFAMAALDEGLRGTGVTLPLVSVVVTNFNYERYIVQCLSSIQRQTYENIECLVVDDVSTDGSVAAIQSFIDQEDAAGRFRLLRHEHNLGQLGAFRTGLLHTRGAFVVFVDADDLLLPRFVEAHLRCHLTLPPAAFTSSDQFQIDEHGQVIGGHHGDLRVEGREVHAGTRSLHGPIWVWATTSSMMFRRPVLEMLMPQDVSAYRYCADNYVCHFANLLGGSWLLPDRLGCYRRHGENGFSTNPLIGSRAPTGDMRRHPSHDTLLARMRAHIDERFDDFVRLQSRKSLINTLSRITRPADLPGVVVRLARTHDASATEILRLVLFSVSKWTKAKYRALSDAATPAEIKLVELEPVA